MNGSDWMMITASMGDCSIVSDLLGAVIGGGLAVGGGFIAAIMTSRSNWNQQRAFLLKEKFETLCEDIERIASQVSKVCTEYERLKKVPFKLDESCRDTLLRIDRYVRLYFPSIGEDKLFRAYLQVSEKIINEPLIIRNNAELRKQYWKAEDQLLKYLSEKADEFTGSEKMNSII